jgi:hypothetical protein
VKTKNASYDRRKILALLDNSLTTLEFFVLWRVFSERGKSESTLRDDALYNKSSIIRMSVNKEYLKYHPHSPSASTTPSTFAPHIHLNSNLYTATSNTKDLIDLINHIPVPKQGKRLESTILNGILMVVDCPFCCESTKNFMNNTNHPKQHESDSIEMRKSIWRNILSENQGMFALKNYITTIVINMNKFKIKNSLPILPLGIVVDHDNRVCLLSIVDSSHHLKDNHAAHTHNKKGNNEEEYIAPPPDDIIKEYEARRGALYSFMEFDTLLKYSPAEVEENIKIVHTTLLCDNRGTDYRDRDSSPSNQSGLYRDRDTNQSGLYPDRDTTHLLNQGEPLSRGPTTTYDVHKYKEESETLFDGLVCWLEEKAKQYASDARVSRMKVLGIDNSANTSPTTS